MTVRIRGLVAVIDDEPMVRYILRRTLEDAGAEVVEADNGITGLALVQRHGHALTLVITDLAMPHLGGREVAEVLAIFRPTLPVLCMTGHAPYDGTFDGKPDRRLRCLSKPFTAEVLLEHATVTIAERRETRAYSEEQRTVAKALWQALDASPDLTSAPRPPIDLIEAGARWRRALSRIAS